MGIQQYDNIIIGAGPAGMMASIIASKENKKVLLLEKLPKIGAKLKATGGGRCNLTNTLSNEEFMKKFGREGRFISPALNAFDSNKLQIFFNEIGVETHAPDGFRIFPVGHNSTTIINALKTEINRLGVTLLCSQKVLTLLQNKDKTEIVGVSTQDNNFFSKSVTIATGGKGYPMLGAEGDGYTLAKSVGHKITELHPAMMPLRVKESWVANCRADTLAKVEMRVDLKKYKKLYAKGDLIFTKNGIRGPVVLDFSREITPLLAKFDEVPITINVSKGMNEEQVRMHLKKESKKDNQHTTQTLLETLIPSSLATEFCILTKANPTIPIGKLSGVIRDNLIRLLVKAPLTVNGHDGFKMAMITRGGISLKEINPNTMKSKKIENLYFCGEVMNLDGPCGGYNLQWSFASGFLAGKLL